jgi:hypothetical protein
VYRKWRPDRSFVTPRKLGEELKDSKSRPTKVLGGSERMIKVEAIFFPEDGGVDEEGGV